MRNCIVLPLLLFLLFSGAVHPDALFAGMAAPLPEDVATVLRLRAEPLQRVQSISFFLAALLLAALVVKWLWNGLRSEFSSLPRLSFGKAIMVTLAWGALFSVVLVMISGARELMTPGAWKKTGATYQLNDAEHAGNEADAE